MLVGIALSSLALAAGVSATASCELKTFKNVPPAVFGIEVTDIYVEEVKGWDEFTTSAPTNPPLAVHPKPLDFCNVTVFYTHPGLNDSVRVSAWLPLDGETWNGRFMGQGGGGWGAGHHGSLSSGVAMGFAAANTDAGHNYFGDMVDSSLTSKSWSLTSPGNVNLHLLQNFGYRALDELTLIGKHVTVIYYETDIKFSYWNGCSTGGRQGLVLAQRYPAHYDGILAAAPAINWVTFLVTEFWGHVKMHELKYYPPACELNAITEAAIEKCDELDGVKDHVIAAAGLCNFDPKTVVGHKYKCGDETRKISKEATEIASAVWNGPIRKKDGSAIWFGLTHEAALAGLDPIFRGLASTNCDTSEKNCASSPFGISADWILNFIFKEPKFDLSEINEELFHHVLRVSRQQYHSLMDSADPDLSYFKEAGGKIITWHGLADQLIPPNGSLNYYERVSAAVPDTPDFFRYFEAPGVAHCFGGDGAFPATAFNSLMSWVEEGKVPEHLDGQSVPAFGRNPEAEPHARPICAWPKVARYIGGDALKAESFECADDFGELKAETGKKEKHDEL